MSIVSEKQETIPTPILAPIPQTAEPRLIDSGLIHYEASIAGFAERYGRGETSHTVHVWWARRPHTAMRSLVFASLCKDANDFSYNILTQISSIPSLSESLINNARRFLSQQYNSPPKVLDMFGGGGTIPYESLNLGAEAYSLDSNELSVFIQKCNLVYSQAKNHRNTPSLLKESGHRVLQQLAIDTDPLFPLRKAFPIGNAQDSPIGYLWTYSICCDQCGYRYYLSKRPWLSKKKRRNLALRICNSENNQKVSIEKVQDDYKNPNVWTRKNGTVQCPNCKFINCNIDISSCIEEIVAVIHSSSKSFGKEFTIAVKDAIPSSKVLEEIENKLLKELNIESPSSSPPIWSGIVNPPLYGIKTHSDFLNQRQRMVLLLLIKNLLKEYQFLTTKYDRNTANYSIAFLSSLIDQIVDWNCRLSMWIPQNEQVGRAFCGPGIAMLWDYVETDPLMLGPSNLWGKLRRIINAAKLIPKFPYKAHVQHGYAQSLPFPDEYFDAIVTDPPYYDNLYYNVLADYFFAWKRLLLSRIDRKLFRNTTTDSKYELVSSTHRNGSPDQAHEQYCLQLGKAINESCRTLKPEGVMSFIFSHSTIKAWEAIVRAYRPTRLTITSVQPLSIERKQRPRAISSEAINTCIIFVAHKSMQHKKEARLTDLMKKLEDICSSDFVLSLENSGWHERDIAIAVYAHGVALLANIKTLSDCSSDIHALLTFDQIVRNKFPGFSVKKRKSL